MIATQIKNSLLITHYQLHITNYSFISKCFNWVSPRSSPRLAGNGQQCYPQRYQPGQCKYPPAQLGAIGEVLQPLIHGVIGNGGGNDEGDGDPFYKVSIEHDHYFPYFGTVYFADADFFGAGCQKSEKQDQ
jgi:hypothetical protein